MSVLSVVLVSTFVCSAAFVSVLSVVLVSTFVCSAALCQFFLLS